MQFLAIYSCSQFKDHHAFRTFFLAMPMIADEQVALTKIHSIDRYYKENFTSVSQFMEDADYDYHYLPQFAVSNIEQPEFNPEIAEGVSSDQPSVVAIIPMNDTIATGKWFTVEQEHLSDYRTMHLEHTSVNGFRFYLRDEMSKDKTRAKRSIFKHYLAGYIQIDFDASEPSKDNLAITDINFSKTGPVPSRDFVALSCLYSNYQMHITTLNNALEKSKAYRVDYYQNAFDNGTALQE